MLGVYTVQRLAPESVDQAYPLVQAIEPSLRPAEWRRLCASLRDSGYRQAVLVVRAPTRRFCALCTVRVLPRPGARPVLLVPRLVIGHAIDPVNVGQALLQALAEHAEEQGCDAIRISMAGSDRLALRALDAACAALGIGLAVELV